MARKSKRDQFKGANGTGSVYERPNGRYQGQVTLGRKADGSPRRLTRTFATKNEASAWVRKTLVGIEEGTFTEPSRVTVREVYRHWVASNAGWSEATLRDTDNALKHALPIIGGVRVHDLTPALIQNMLNELRLKPAGWPPRAKGAPENDPLSEAMIRRVLERTRALLNHAVRMELAPRNVAQRVPLPKVEVARRTPWSLREVRKVIEWCQGSSDLWTRDYWIVALGTGLRKQELRGLRWSDIAPEHGLLRVRQVAIEATGGPRIKSVPKSEAGYRTVDFDGVTAAALQRQHTVTGAGGLVFSREGDGGILGSRKLILDMRRVAAGAGVRVIPVYDTRHTHGTLLAQAGVNPKVLSMRMGHANVALTLSVYVNPDRDAQRAAGGVMAALLLPAATENDSTGGEEAGEASSESSVTQAASSGN